MSRVSWTLQVSPVFSQGSLEVEGGGRRRESEGDTTMQAGSFRKKAMTQRTQVTSKSWKGQKMYSPLEPPESKAVLLTF